MSCIFLFVGDLPSVEQTLGPEQVGVNAVLLACWELHGVAFVAFSTATLDRR
jgi:hypothetical protein